MDRISNKMSIQLSTCAHHSFQRLNICYYHIILTAYTGAIASMIYERNRNLTNRRNGGMNLQSVWSTHPFPKSLRFISIWMNKKKRNDSQISAVSYPAICILGSIEKLQQLCARIFHICNQIRRYILIKTF